MILSALELRRHFEEFAARAPDIDPDHFGDEFYKFVAHVQRHL
jgi:hypothetical protein